jgi:hypothetical protein
MKNMNNETLASLPESFRGRKMASWRIGPMAKITCLAARIFAGKFTDFYAFFRGFPQFYAQNRAVITQFYAFLRVRLIFLGDLPSDEPQTRHERGGLPAHDVHAIVQPHLVAGMVPSGAAKCG